MKRRRASGKRVGGKKTKKAKTGSGRRRVSKGGGNVMITLKRQRYYQVWTWGTTATGDFWRYYEPTLADMNNSTEFVNIFEQYRINAIKIQLRPRNNDFSTTGTNMPQAVTCIDPEQVTAPVGTYTSSTLNVLLEDNKCKYRSIGAKGLSVYFKPKIAVPTNVGSGVMYKSAPWLRTADTAVPHRGVNIFLHAPQFALSNAAMVYDVILTHYVSFRNLK